MCDPRQEVGLQIGRTLSSLAEPTGSSTGLAMAFKLIKAAQARWRASAHRSSSRSSALAPASNGKLVERPEPT
jgi:hypothetical protein